MSETSSQSQLPAEPRPHNHGAFVWHELMTSDVDKAKAFYGQLFGWRFEAVEMGDMVYHVIQARDQGLGGLFNQNDPTAPSSVFSDNLSRYGERDVY